MSPLIADEAPFMHLSRVLRREKRFQGGYQHKRGKSEPLTMSLKLLDDTKSYFSSNVPLFIMIPLSFIECLTKNVGRKLSEKLKIK